MGENTARPRIWALASALRDARLTSGIGVRELARMLSISPTQISFWESGERVPSAERVAMILTAVRTSANERERILELARHVREPNWITVGVNGIPEQLAGVVECERLASAITDWSLALIPGLLQISEYARAITETGGLPSHDVELRGMINAGRPQILKRSDVIKFEALIAESVLYEPIGGPVVMQSQLNHLIEMGNHSNVDIRIVPSRCGWHPGLAGPFILYSFPGSLSVVYFEHHSSGAFIPSPHDVAEYHKAVAWLKRIAKNPQESLALIEKARNDMEAVT